MRRERELLTEREATLPTRRSPGSRYWLMAKNENGRIEVLTVDRGGEQALPVFGHEEEAEMFLRLGGVGDGWRVRESTAGELVSVLYGPCARVGRVALDPLPEMLDEKAVGLVSLDRERFLDLVLDRGRFPRRRGTTREVSPPKRDRDLRKTKKTGFQAHMSKAEREKCEDGSRSVDDRGTDTRPRNWPVAATLLMLRERASCGYELMKRASQFSLGAMNPGTLYRTLRQMEKEGLCKSEWETSECGSARRAYYITDAGASHLDSWAESLGRCGQMVDAFSLAYGGEAVADGDGSKDGNESKDGDGWSRLAPSNLIPERPGPREGI